MAGGTYAVTVVGGCVFDLRNQSVSTPCNGPTGPIPCVTVNNVPSAVCFVAAGTAWVDVCPTPPAVHFCGDTFWFEVDGQCLQTPVAGTINHPTAGPLRARFADSLCCYFDNVGAFVVTLVWTPL